MIMTFEPTVFCTRCPRPVETERQCHPTPVCDQCLTSTEMKRAKTDIPDALTSSTRQDWITPPQLVDFAHNVLGRIDLDPASSDQANSVVKAQRFISEADNGLGQRWSGRVWCNPPYGKIKGKSSQGVWGLKMAYEFQSGHIDAGMLLVTSKTGERWFQELWDQVENKLDGDDCSCNNRILFLSTRVKFIHPETMRPERQPSQSHCIFLFSWNSDITDRFGRFGEKVGRVLIP